MPDARHDLGWGVWEAISGCDLPRESARINPEAPQVILCQVPIGLTIERTRRDDLAIELLDWPRIEIAFACVTDRTFARGLQFDQDAADQQPVELGLRILGGLDPRENWMIGGLTQPQ